MSSTTYNVYFDKITLKLWSKPCTCLNINVTKHLLGSEYNNNIFKRPGERSKNVPESVEQM